jgi:hypothetical protein
MVEKLWCSRRRAIGGRRQSRSNVEILSKLRSIYLRATAGNSRRRTISCEGGLMRMAGEFAIGMVIVLSYLLVSGIRQELEEDGLS